MTKLQNAITSLHAKFLKPVSSVSL